MKIFRQKTQTYIKKVCTPRTWDFNVKINLGKYV